MKDRKRRRKRGVRKIGIKLRQQPPRAQCLVKDRARRNRSHIPRQPRALELLPCKIQTTIEIHRVVRRYQHMPDCGQRRGRDRPQHLRTDRHRTPRQNLSLLRAKRLVQCIPRSLRIPVQKHHSNPQRLLMRQFEAHVAQQQLARNGRHDANPIARLPVSGHRAAMLQPPQRSQRMLQNPMRRLARKLRHKSNPARLLVKPRIHQIRKRITPGKPGGFRQTQPFSSPTPLRVRGRCMKGVHKLLYDLYKTNFQSVAQIT